MAEIAAALPSIAVVIFAACAAMWLNDRFHLGGEFDEDAP
jgi:hypothetical protein